MEIYGLLGEKLGHSLSPFIYPIIVEGEKRSIAYNLFEVKREKFSNVIKSGKTLGIKGYNVTIPYKHEIIYLLDDISDDAKAIGAVNTVKFFEDKAIGYNTDYFGFGDMIKLNDVVVDNNDFVVLGNGGAAKSVIQYLANNNAKSISIVSRSVEKKELINAEKNISQISYDELKNIKQSYGIINTTPVGMYPKIENCPVDEKVLEKFQVAMDLIYNPIETVFLKKAKSKNLKTVSGMYMLVGQALNSWAIWNDIDVDYSKFDKIYDEVKKLLKM